MVVGLMVVGFKLFNFFNLCITLFLPFLALSRAGR